MSDNHQILMESSLSWLKEKVFPLWLRVGVDPNSNTFTENLSFNGTPQVSPKRALVQARQIYAFAEGLRLGVLDNKVAQPIIVETAKSFIKNYSLPNGAFVHSVDLNGKHLNLDLDLYTQAFALFGLAQAYEISKKEEFKNSALLLVKYLTSERQNLAGGFTEIKNKQVLFQSNPHMHLFESAIAWVKIDKNSVWSDLAQELYDLCVSKFIDSSTGLLAEHFDQSWHPQRENGNFVFEPGHHYEWSWLLFKFRELIPGQNNHSRNLFDLAEHLGLSTDRELALDEIWSNGSVRKSSSRFWPQCERIKAAMILGEAQVADVAMKILIRDFLLMEQGLWKDTLLEKGQYADIPVKASSLYHIINAISEFVQYRSKIGA